MLNIEQDVRSAAEILDRLKPNWFELVNTDRLYMGTLHLCILAYVFDHQSYGDSLFYMKENGYRGTSGFGTGKEFWLIEIQNRKESTLVQHSGLLQKRNGGEVCTRNQECCSDS